MWSYANRVAVLRVPAGMRKIRIQYFNVSEPVEYHELRVEPGKHYDYRISGTAGMLMGEWRFERLNSAGVRCWRPVPALRAYDRGGGFPDRPGA